MSSVDQPGQLVYRADRLTYRYLGRFTALNAVSFTVTAGERVALLGANGCGKSTLLRMLAGLVPPQQGRLDAFGEPLTETSLADEQANARFRTRVGIVFQNPDTQVFSATVAEEVAFGCRQLRMTGSDTAGRVEDVMRMLAITDLADRTPFQLSGGQKKKVALASVLVMNPDVILFDEPTAALDPRTQHWLIDLIARLGDAGKTIIVATHDLHTLADLTDRALVMDEDHSLRLDAPTPAVLEDRRTLLDVNLIHDHDLGTRHR
jgi:cobalt/nickel transport system ATP-binding protein